MSGALNTPASFRSRLESFRYTVQRPPDPLMLSETAEAAGLADGRFHASADWLVGTIRARFPDFVSQIVDYFDSPRAGEMIVFSADGWDFSQANRGSHGGIGQQDMIVPMAFAGPGLPAGGQIPLARTVDLLPTLLEFLGRPDALGASGPIDGVSRLEELRGARSRRPTTARDAP